MASSAAGAPVVDVVVYGSSGDVGRVMCSMLFYRGQTLGIKSWAPAGRSAAKIANVLGNIATDDAPADGIKASPIIYADSGDDDSLLRMASQAKVVVACAGPFSLYGEPVVRACVKAGVDYVDITGELDWVAQMKRKYGAEAKSKGLRIVPMAGYDSVPSDICTWGIFDALKAENESVSSVETRFSAKGGGLPAGTLNTIIIEVDKGKQALLSGLSFGLLGKKREKKLKETDLAASIEPFVPKEAKSAIAADLKGTFLWPYSSLYGNFAAPHFMAAANIPVVHSTAVQFGYGGIKYRERVGSVKPSASSLWGAIPAFLIMMTLTSIGVLSMLPFFESGLRWFVQKFNTDTKKKAHDNLINGFQPSGGTRVGAMGISKNKNIAAIANLKSDYDPGLGFTTQTTLAVASALVSDARQGNGFGFGTAVGVIGGKPLIEALGRAGVSVDVKTKTA